MNNLYLRCSKRNGISSNNNSIFPNYKWTRVGLMAILNVLILGMISVNAQMSGMMDKTAKIQNAMSSAPKSIAEHATIMDWPKAEGEQPSVLQDGTNGWTCFPDNPKSEGNDPMCVDDQWMAFFDAYMKQETPKITKMGIGYMLAGDSFVSNTDPFAKEETPDNEWGQEGPHLMVVVPNNEILQDLNTDRTKGEPYVMFRNTPYAHIMIPVPGQMEMSSVN